MNGICKSCGKECKGIFCKKCYGKEKTKVNRVKKICKRCKKEYFVIKSRENVSNYCSKKCLYGNGDKSGICSSCGKEFVAKYKKIYCSHICRAESKKLRKQIICDFCGNSFESFNYLNPKFCSHKCYVESIKGKLKGNKNRTTLECVNCNSPFEVWGYRKDNARFCSTECYDDYRQSKLKCPSCLKEFVSPNYEERKYCSQECAAKGVGKRISKFFLSVFNFIKNVYKEEKIERERMVKGDKYKYYIDITINNDIAIECDGTWWHCDKEIFDKKYFHPKIRKYAWEIWKRDKQKDKLLESNGYVVLRLKEFKWKSDEEFFNLLKEKIDEILQDKKDKKC